MGITITILGSGTCVPSLKRSSCSFLIRIHNNLLLFDLGVGTMRRLMEAGEAISKVTHLFFTHFHPDHTGEFVPFLFATKYPQTYSRRTSFNLIGAKGLQSFYEGLLRVYNKWIELEEGLMNIIELAHHTHDQRGFDMFKVDTFPMAHIDSSIGYRITATDGTCIVYTGDTDFCENAVTLARDADLFICEAALPDAMKVEGHLTPSLAGTIATEAGAKHLVLTHFYPECERVDVKAECRRTYNGPLTLAQDLMVIEVARFP